MSLSPIPRVLFILRKRRVRALLMGGQACILYGAAEFSRDVDIAVSVEPANLARLRAALRDLRAQTVYFPPLSQEALQKGHACHFRCLGAGLRGVRLDIMSVMRGADPFEKLWSRRARVKIAGFGTIAVMALEDLVVIKKTQRDKDWPMVRRLIEADVARRKRAPARRVRFWIQECRTSELLMDLASKHPKLAASSKREAVRLAMKGNARRVDRALQKEQERERELDRRYWAPLKAELESWGCTDAGMRANITSASSPRSPI